MYNNKCLQFAATVAAVVWVGVIVAAVPAKAITGRTSLTITFEEFGYVWVPVGAATRTEDTFLFPITGGDILSGGSTIEHEGSGIGYRSGEPIGGSGDFDLLNFSINVSSRIVFSDKVRDFGFTRFEDVPTFIFGTGTDLPGVQLLTTEPAFPNNPQDEFGYAVPAPAPVPVPAAGALLLGGLFTLGLVRTRRKEVSWGAPRSRNSR